MGVVRRPVGRRGSGGVGRPRGWPSPHVPVQVCAPRGRRVMDGHGRPGHQGYRTRSVRGCATRKAYPTPRLALPIRRFPPPVRPGGREAGLTLPPATACHAVRRPPGANAKRSAAAVGPRPCSWPARPRPTRPMGRAPARKPSEHRRVPRRAGTPTARDGFKPSTLLRSRRLMHAPHNGVRSCSFADQGRGDVARASRPREAAGGKAPGTEPVRRASRNRIRPGLGKGRGERVGRPGGPRVGRPKSAAPPWRGFRAGRPGRRSWCIVGGT